MKFWKSMQVKHYILIVSLIIAISSIALLLPSGLTGFTLFTVTVTGEIDVPSSILVSSNTPYKINFPPNESVTSVRISGKITGEGNVKITLTDGKKKWTVFEKKIKEEDSLGIPITGLLIDDVADLVDIIPETPTEELIPEPEANVTEPDEEAPPEETAEENVTDVIVEEPEENITEEVAEENVTIPDEEANVTEPEEPETNVTEPEENVTEPEPETNVTIPEENVTEPEINITGPDEEPEENVTEPEANVTIEENVTVPEENVTIPEENITEPEINVTEPEENVTEPEEPETNVTIEENVTIPEENVTIINETNVTIPEDNITEENVTEEPVIPGFVFTDICDESCVLPPVGDAQLIIQVGGEAELELYNISYDAEKTIEIEEPRKRMTPEEIESQMEMLGIEDLFPSLDLEYIYHIDWSNDENGDYMVYIELEDGIINTSLENLKKMGKWILSSNIGSKSSVRILVRLNDYSKFFTVGDTETTYNEAEKKITTSSRLSKKEVKERFGQELYESVMYFDAGKEAYEVLRAIDGYISLEVTSDGLQVLLDNDIVEEVSLDRPFRSHGGGRSMEEIMNMTDTHRVHDLGYSGAGQKVCILDTAVNITALGLVENVTVFGKSYGMDFLDYDEPVLPHGTQVTYIIKSMAPNATFYIADVYSDESAYSSDMISALDWCAENNVSVVSISMGEGKYSGYCDSRPVARKVNDLVYNKSIVVVASTGNRAFRDAVANPACASGAIPVAAAINTTAFQAQSNINNATMILAPTNISAISTGGNHTRFGGTSASAPQVAAAAMLVLESTPMDPVSLRDLLVHTGIAMDTAHDFGHNLTFLNVYNAVTGNMTNNYTAGELGQVNESDEDYEENIRLHYGPFCTYYSWSAMSCDSQSCCYWYTTTFTDTCRGYWTSFNFPCTNPTCEHCDGDTAWCGGKDTGRGTGCDCDTGTQCSQTCIDTDTTCGSSATCQTIGSAYDCRCCSDDANSWTQDGTIAYGASWACDATEVAHDGADCRQDCSYIGSNGVACDTDGYGGFQQGGDGPPYGYCGVCIGSLCDYGLVGCSGTGASCGATYYTGCSSTGSLRYCDSNVDCSEYVRNGVCGGAACCTGLIDSGDWSGTAESWTEGDEDCSCTAGYICDSGGLASSTPSANGVCRDAVCDINSVEVNCGAGACTTGDYTDGNMDATCDTASGNSCDYDVTTAGFQQDGICASGETNNCATAANSAFVCYQTTPVPTYRSDAAAAGSCAHGAACDKTYTNGDFNGRNPPDTGNYVFYVYFKAYGGTGCNDITDEYCLNMADDISSDCCCEEDADATLESCCDPDTDTCASGFVATQTEAQVNGEWAYCWGSGNGHWRDLDYRQENCEQANSGAFEWDVSGEGGTQFGEYDSGDTTTFECCGDDTSEYWEYRNVHFNHIGESGFLDDSSDDACCNANDDCIYDETCFAPGIERDPLGVGRGTHRCYSNAGTYGTWINTDYHSSYCSTYDWNVGDGDATGDGYQGSWGADSVGYCRNQNTTQGGSFVASIHCCCGDDANENYLYQNCDNSYACYDDSSDDACCDASTDCVNAGCFTSGTSTEDVNGNGDDEYCSNGIWYDCQDTGDCDPTNEPAYGDDHGQNCTGSSECSEACTSNDCIYKRYNGWTDCDVEAACVSGNCMQDTEYAGTADAGVCDSADGCICNTCDTWDVCIPATGCPFDNDWDEVMSDCHSAEGGNCYASSGDTNKNVDNDGDNDYCNSGTWYDCPSNDAAGDANCLAAQNCDGSDCLADFVNGVACIRNSQCTSGICDTDGCDECVSTTSDRDGDLYNDDLTCDACPDDPADTSGDCRPHVGGYVVIPEDSSEYYTWYDDSDIDASGMDEDGTSDLGVKVTSGAGCFDCGGPGSQSSENYGNWVRTTGSASISTYPRLSFAYRVPAGDDACVMALMTGLTWRVVGATSGYSCSGYTDGADKKTLFDDGAWHIVTYDLSQDAGATGITSVITGSPSTSDYIYIDKIYQLKNVMYTGQGAAERDQTLWISCWDDDGGDEFHDEGYSTDRILALLNFQNGGTHRGYFYIYDSGTYGEAGGDYGQEFTDISSASTWTTGDNRIATATFDAQQEWSELTNAFSIYCDEGDIVDGWEYEDDSTDSTVYQQDFDAYACPSDDATGDTYCTSAQYCAATPDTACNSDLGEGVACTRDNECSDTTYSRSCYEGSNNLCQGTAGSSSGECRRDDGQSCTTGDSCGSGVCNEGTCQDSVVVDQCDTNDWTCGDDCSADGTSYLLYNQQMHGPTNYGCSANMPISDYAASFGTCQNAGTGDNRDADCPINCDTGLYTDTSVPIWQYPYQYGRCIQLRTFGQTCCQPRGYGSGGSGGGDCAANMNCTAAGASGGTCLYVDGQSCTGDAQCYSGYCDDDGVGLADDDHCYTPSGTLSRFDGQEPTMCEYDTGNGVDAFSDEHAVSWPYNNKGSASEYYGCPAYSSCYTSSNTGASIHCQGHDGDNASAFCSALGSYTWMSSTTDEGVDSSNCGAGVTHCGDGVKSNDFCCGDDANENFIDGAGALNSQEACCDSSTDCADSVGNCISSGGYTAYSDTKYYCDSGTWEGDIPANSPTYEVIPGTLSGIISYWDFNEGSGGTAYDKAGRNNGSITDASWTGSGYSAGALDFDGSGDYVSVADADATGLDFTGSLSLSAWIKTTQNSGSYPVIAGKGFLAGGVNGYGLYLRDTENYNVTFQVRNDSTVSQAIGLNLSDGQWHHVVGVRDHDNMITYIYIDGEYYANDTGTAIVNYSHNYAFGIGQRHSGGWAFPFNGTIDEVQVYDRALSADEIEEMYLGVGSKHVSFYDDDEDLILYYPFEEVSGSKAEDWSVNNNDGTIVDASYISGGAGLGGALSFNDTDRIYTDGSALDSLSNEVTVSLWQYGDVAIQPQADTIFYANDTSNNRVLNIHLPWSNAVVYWDAGNSGTASYDRLTNTTDIDASEYEGQWNHWVFTKNATTGVMAYYVNGVLKASSTGNVRTFPTISNVYVGSTGSYDGYVDEVRVYDSALSDGEVADLYFAGKPHVGLYRSASSSGTYESVLQVVPYPDAETGDTTGWSNWDGVTTTDPYEGTYSYTRTGDETSGQILSDKYIPVDDDKTYTVSGYFKSNTTGYLSRLYFGFVRPYTKDKQQILCRYVNTKNIYATLYNATQASDTVVYIDDTGGTTCSTWTSNLGSYPSMAFDADDSGDYTDLPNFNTKGYITALVDGGIYCAVTLPAVGAVYSGGTKVRLHSDCGNQYTGASNQYVPNSWTPYSGTVKGEAVSGAPNNQWWPGTRYTRILILANYNQNDSHTLLADNITLTVGDNGIEYSDYLTDPNSDDNANPGQISSLDSGAVNPEQWTSSTGVDFSWEQAVDHGTGYYYYARSAGVTDGVSNYVDNGGFENGLLGWIAYGAIDTMESSTDQARTGSHSLKLVESSTSGTTGAQQPAANYISPDQGSYYLLSSYVYVSLPIAGTRWELHRQGLDDVGCGDSTCHHYDTISEDDWFDNSIAKDTWVRKYILLYPWDDMLSLKIMPLSFSASGTVYWDDIFVDEVKNHTVTSGLDGYAYACDQSGGTNPTGKDIENNDTTQSCTFSAGTNYFHIRSIDNEGNLGTTYTTAYWICTDSDGIVDSDNDDGDPSVSLTDADNTCACSSTDAQGPDRCDPGVDGTGNGVCVQINNGATYDCETDGTEICFGGTYYENDCTYCSDTNGCDTNGGTTYSRNGYCCLNDCDADGSVAYAGDCCDVDALCDDSTPSSCRVSDNTCRFDSGQSCTAGENCTSSLCVDGVCRASCDTWSGYGCSNNTNPYTTEGTCYDENGVFGCDIYDAIRMSCDAAGCEIGGDSTYKECSTTSGDSCDSGVGGNFSQDGTCAEDATNDCDTSGEVVKDGSTYYDDCTNHVGAECDTDATSGGDYSFGAATMGYCLSAGTCDSGCASSPSGDQFKITDSGGSVVATIDESGDMFVDGDVYESQGSLSPPAGSFIVQNVTGDVVAYVSDSGDLYMQGTVTTEDVTGIAGYNLEIRDSSDTIVAWFDDDGNLKLAGCLVKHYSG